MTYVEKTLRPGETLLSVARLHPIIYAKSIGCCIICLAALLTCLYEPLRIEAVCVAITFATLAFCLALPPAWQQITTEIACTNQRLIVKKGFFFRHTQEMSLSNVETTSVDQSLVGVMLGYGTLHCRGSGEGIEHIHQIAKPLDFRSSITT